MKRNQLLHLLYVACLFILLTACNNDEKQNDLSLEQINATYSNKLSAPKGGNLMLTYSGQACIGKDIYFKMKKANTADITLFGVLPGEAETTIPDVSLTFGTDNYAFSGHATGAGGTTFQYEGTVAAGKMSFALTDVVIPSSSLTRQGTWYIIHRTKTAHTVYNGVGGEGGSMNSLVGMLYSFVVNNLLGNAISSVLDNVTFHTDGNITAAYAPLPDSISIGKLISGVGVTGRPASDWQQSPTNLCTYSVKNGSDLYLILNIDMIIRQAQQNKGTKAEEAGLAEAIKKVYKRLNTWTTTGIKLSVSTPGPQYTGNKDDILLLLEKEEIEDLFLLIDLAKAIIPAETLDKPVSEALAGIIPPEYAGLIDLLLKGESLGALLDKVHNELNTIPLEIGLYLSKEQRN